MKKILLIDGNWLFNTFYYSHTKNMLAAKAMQEKEEDVVLVTFNVVFNILKTTLQNHYDEFYTFFDNMSKPNFRKELFPEYKAHRSKEKKFAFNEQLQKTKLVLQKLNIIPFNSPGKEADDLIGSWAKFKAQDPNINQIDILTADKDLYQLIDDKIHIVHKVKNENGFNVLEPVDQLAITEKFNIPHPINIIDLKALSGDASDNYKGVAKIGPKTASKAISYFGSVNELLKFCEMVKNNEIEYTNQWKAKIGLSLKNIENILQNKDIILRNQQLATIDTKIFDNHLEVIDVLNGSVKPNEINIPIIKNLFNNSINFFQDLDKKFQVLKSKTMTNNKTFKM